MKKISLLALVFAFPMISMAVPATDTSIFTNIGTILGRIVPILLTLAVIYFFYGLGTYILGAGDEESKSKGRGIMIWGVVALFVMVSVWGLVGVLGEVSGVGAGSVTVPALPSI